MFKSFLLFRNTKYVSQKESVMKTIRQWSATLVALIFFIQPLSPSSFAYANVASPTVDPALSVTTPVQSVADNNFSEESAIETSAQDQFENAGPLSSFTPPQPVSSVSKAIQQSAYNTAALSLLPNQPSLGSGPYLSNKISQTQDSSGAYSFNYNLPKSNDHAYSIINVSGNLGSTFTIGLQGPAGKQLKIELYDGYNRLSYYANLTGSLQNYTITIPADSDSFHSNSVNQIALVVEQDRSGSSGSVQVRTNGLYYTEAASPDSSLTAADINSLNGVKHIIPITPDGAFANVGQTDSSFLELNYQIGNQHSTNGWAAAFASFDDFGTAEIETQDLSGSSALLVGVTSSNANAIKMEVEDIDGRKSIIYLNETNSVEQFYRVSKETILSANPLLDLTRVKGIVYVVEQRNSSVQNLSAGTLQIRFGAQYLPEGPQGWTEATSNPNFAYIVEKTTAYGNDIFTAKVMNLVNGQQYSFPGKTYPAGLTSSSLFSVDVAENSVYAKLISPPQPNIPNTNYLFFNTGIIANQTAPSNPQFAFGFRQSGIGNHYVINLQTGETRFVGQSSRYAQTTLLDVSPNGKYILWRHYSNPSSNSTYLTEAGGTQKSLGVNGHLYNYQFSSDGKLSLTYEAQSYSAPDPGYSQIRKTIEINTADEFEKLQKKIIYEKYYSLSKKLAKTIKYEYGVTPKPKSPGAPISPYDQITVTLFHSNGKIKTKLVQKLNPITSIPFVFDKKVYTAQGIITQRSVGRYHPDGKTIAIQTVTTYNSKGQPSARYTYYYNSKGKLTKKVKA